MGTKLLLKYLIYQNQACLPMPANKNRQNRSAEQMVKVKGKIRSGDSREGETTTGCICNVNSAVIR